MQVFGLDFTSAPRPAKPITCAVCALEGTRLVLAGFRAFAEFKAFEAFLAKKGEWIAGIDFPFGLPRRFLENAGWPDSWEAYVVYVSAMGKPAFLDALSGYKRDRPSGDKEHRRATDALAGALSPMKLYGVPVGKMFYEGAKRLLECSASVPPFVRRDPKRIIVEAYPALVARKFIGSRPYKSDMRAQQTPERYMERQKVVRGINGSLYDYYGLVAHLASPQVAQLENDPTGDTLDAFLCAIQAAWAYGRRQRGYGIPVDSDTLEGWIVDPAMLRGALKKRDAVSGTSLGEARHLKLRPLA